MRNVFFLFISYVFICCSHQMLNAQCPTGTLILETQQEVDDFINTYPDCTDFPGSIVIMSEDITDLSPLSNLKSIEGDLFVGFSPFLENLNGLSNLNYVGMNLGISNNLVLNDISGLSGLNTVGLYLSITGNSALESLNGLSNLNTIGLFLEISQNAALQTTQGLSNLTSVSENCRIYDNEALVVVDGFSSLSEIGSELLIDGNPNLETIAGFSSLLEINTLVISWNPALQTIDGFSNTNYIYSAFIGNNASLQIIDSFPNLNEMTGKLVISNNAELEIIHGFFNLSSIGGLIVRNNPALTSCCAIQCIADVVEFSLGSEITIENNATPCNGLSEIEQNCGANYDCNTQLSVTDLEMLDGVNLQSNIVKNELLLNNTLQHNITAIHIFNMQGQQVFVQKEATRESCIEINLPSLIAGMYFIELIAENNFYSNNFLVK